MEWKNVRHGPYVTAQLKNENFDTCPRSPVTLALPLLALILLPALTSLVRFPLCCRSTQGHARLPASDQAQPPSQTLRLLWNVLIAGVLSPFSKGGVTYNPQHIFRVDGRITFAWMQPWKAYASSPIFPADLCHPLPSPTSLSILLLYVYSHFS